VNVWAPWVLTQRVLPGMRERGTGWVLNMTTSVAELPPGPPFAQSGPSKAGTLYGGSKAMLNRMTVGVASEVEGQGIAVNALTPQAAILTPALQPALDGGHIHSDLFEPLETMIEAAMVLCTASPDELHARIGYSLELLIELGRPVYDLRGEALLEGWQPADLPARLAAQRAALSGGSAGGYGLD
jgi:NAD(P)-dependent dehydrogenase (short-subunit alcohol dehydrogenase family)